MWNACDGKRPVGADVLVEVERGDGTESGAVRADHVAWRHVKRWRLAADGWIEWVGGTCPVAPTARVEFRLADGGTGQDAACNLRWNHDEAFRQADIVAYRVVEADGWTAWGGAAESPVPGHVSVYIAGVDGVSYGPFRADEVAWAFTARYKRAVATTDSATHTYRDEINRLTEQLNKATAAMMEMREQMNGAESQFEALAASDRADLAASRDACAILEAENAALRGYAEHMTREALALGGLRTALSIASLRGHMALDFTVQLAEWSAPRQ